MQFTAPGKRSRARRISTDYDARSWEASDSVLMVRVVQHNSSADCGALHPKAHVPRVDSQHVVGGLQRIRVHVSGVLEGNTKAAHCAFVRSLRSLPDDARKQIDKLRSSASVAPPRRAEKQQDVPGPAHGVSQPPGRPGTSRDTPSTPLGRPGTSHEGRPTRGPGTHEIRTSRDTGSVHTPPPLVSGGEILERAVRVS